MKIIIHIGAGKTGTSSLQQYLKNNLDALIEEGIMYAGPCFNIFGADKGWQRRNLGYGLPSDKITKIYLEETKKFIAICKQKKCHTLILCNEAFSSNIGKLIPYLEKIKRNHELSICFYTRKPEDWTRSAYEQWGIRHKVYEGPIISAEQYVSQKPYLIMLQTLSTLINEGLQQHLVIRNLDNAGNVIDDFCSVYDLPKYESIRVNESVGELDLSLFYYLNNPVKGRASNRKGRELSAIVRKTKVDDFQEKAIVKEEYFDLEHIGAFKEFFNRYLDDDNKFDLEFNLKDKVINKLSDNELRLGKVCANLFNVVYQCKNGFSGDLGLAIELLEDSNSELTLRLKRLKKIINQAF